jgi:biopolymer transport protein ExbD
VAQAFMRRFSQRNPLVTLSDINITPLLDLAFVLLIIFVITTPLLTQSINLQLPGGGKMEKKQMNPRDVRTIEVNPGGQYYLDGKTLPLNQIEAILVETHRTNPNLIVVIRADRNARWEIVSDLLDICLKHDITKFSVRTDPRRK